MPAPSPISYVAPVGFIKHHIGIYQHDSKGNQSGITGQEYLSNTSSRNVTPACSAKCIHRTVEAMHLSGITPLRFDDLTWYEKLSNLWRTSLLAGRSCFTTGMGKTLASTTRNGSGEVLPGRCKSLTNKQCVCTSLKFSYRRRAWKVARWSRLRCNYGETVSNPRHPRPLLYSRRTKDCNHTSAIQPWGPRIGDARSQPLGIARRRARHQSPRPRLPSKPSPHIRQANGA